jgi:hypothetical protein
VIDVLVTSAAKPIKVFVSSRRDIDIRRQLKDGPNMTIQVTNNLGDISTFVYTELTLQEKRQHGKLSTALRTDIVNTLQAKS